MRLIGHVILGLVTSVLYNLSHICVYKPIIIQTPGANFDRDLKGLVLVGDPCLVADKDILEVLQELRSLQGVKSVP